MIGPLVSSNLVTSTYVFELFFLIFFAIMLCMAFYTSCK